MTDVITYVSDKKTWVKAELSYLDAAFKEVLLNPNSFTGNLRRKQELKND
jgi:hypothetical protein